MVIKSKFTAGNGTQKLTPKLICQECDAGSCNFCASYDCKCLHQVNCYPDDMKQPKQDDPRYLEE